MASQRALFMAIVIVPLQLSGCIPVRDKAEQYAGVPVSTTVTDSSLSGVWKSDTHGYQILLEHKGNTVIGKLLHDFQKPGYPLQPAGQVVFSGSVFGNRISGTGLLIQPLSLIKSCNLSAFTEVDAKGEVTKDLNRLTSTSVVTSIEQRTCRLLKTEQATDIFTRQNNEHRCTYRRDLRPNDSVASDCTPGRLLSPGSPRHTRVLGALNRVEALKPKPVFNVKDPHQYLIFVATDGTGNHNEQFVVQGDPVRTSVPTRYSPDQCISMIQSSYEARGNLAYTAPPSNPLLLYNQVVTENGRQPNIRAIYVRGVGTDPNGPDLFSSQQANRLKQAEGTWDLNRQIDEAYSLIQKEVAKIYEKDTQAKFVFVTTGFSRGATAARALHNKILTEGIATPVETFYQLKKNGDANPPRYIISPQTANIAATVLYDTVVSTLFSAGSLAIPRNTIGLHVTAENEYRNKFPLTPTRGTGQVIEIAVPGAHSDIGGTYTTDGISAVTLRMGLIYLRKIGVPVGSVESEFHLKESYRPNVSKFVIHDSRWCPEVEPFAGMHFDRIINYRRPIESSY